MADMPRQYDDGSGVRLRELPPGDSGRSRELPESSATWLTHEPQFVSPPPQQTGHTQAPPPRTSSPYTAVAPPPSRQRSNYGSAGQSWLTPPTQRSTTSADSTASDGGAFRAPARDAPRSGWRGFVWRATNGRLNPGPSPSEDDERDLVRRINAPYVGGRNITVACRKGGGTKTTVALAVGSVLATYRQDRTVAMDSNPDGGNLGLRVPRRTRATIRDLRLAQQHWSLSPVEVEDYINFNQHRLGVVAAPLDDNDAEFTGDNYKIVHDPLARYFKNVITDTGTSIPSDVMQRGILPQTHQLVFAAPTTPSVDAEVARTTLNALVANGYHDLVANAVTVLTVKTKEQSPHNQELIRYYADRTRAVVVVPHEPLLAPKTDTHEAENWEFDLNELRPATRLAYLRAAAIIVDGLVAMTST